MGMSKMIYGMWILNVVYMVEKFKWNILVVKINDFIYGICVFIERFRNLVYL